MFLVIWKANKIEFGNEWKVEPRTKPRVKPKEPHRASLFGTTFDRTSAITWHLIHLYILGFKWSVFWTYLNLSLEFLEKQLESFAEDREEIVNVFHIAGIVLCGLHFGAKKISNGESNGVSIYGSLYVSKAE